jgi:hypothetical protein
LLLCLTSCDSLGIRDIFARDQVPPDVKAAPLQVASPAPIPEDAPKVWPRLGDVPFKPKDFSPPPVYNQNMDELEFQRAEAGADKMRVEDEAPLQSVPVMPHDGLTPPLFPKE